MRKPLFRRILCNDFVTSPRASRWSARKRRHLLRLHSRQRSRCVRMDAVSNGASRPGTPSPQTQLRGVRYCKESTDHSIRRWFAVCWARWHQCPLHTTSQLSSDQLIYRIDNAIVEPHPWRTASRSDVCNLRSRTRIHMAAGSDADVRRTCNGVAAAYDLFPIALHRSGPAQYSSWAKHNRRQKTVSGLSNSPWFSLANWVSSVGTRLFPSLLLRRKGHQIVFQTYCTSAFHGDG